MEGPKANAYGVSGAFCRKQNPALHKGRPADRD
jgi:hypothetical protein